MKKHFTQGLITFFGKQSLLLICLLSYGLLVSGQTITTGDYRTTGAATFSSANNWQTYNGSSWVAASTAPAAVGSTMTATATVGTQFTSKSAIGATVATFSNVTTTASTTINVASTNGLGLANGMFVSGPNIPSLATISSFTATTIVISAAASVGTGTITVSTPNQITGVSWSANASTITFNQANLTGTPVVGQPIIGSNFPANAYIYAVNLNGASSTLQIATSVTTPAPVSITNASSSVTLTFGTQLAGSNIIELQSTTGIYVGTPIVTLGIPANSYVTAVGIDGNPNSIQISSTVTGGTRPSNFMTTGGIIVSDASSYLGSINTGTISVGNLVVSSLFPAGTTVSAVSGNWVTFSQAATGYASASSLSFYPAPTNSNCITNMFINHATTVDASNLALIANLYVNNTSSTNAGTGAVYSNATLTIGNNTTARALTIGNLTVASSASVVVGANNAKHTLSIMGTTTTGSNTSIANYGTITLYNNTSQYCSVYFAEGYGNTGTATINNGSYTFNDLFVSSGAKLVAPSAMTLYSNLTNNGTFTHNNGIITFSGNASISGTTMPTLYNMTIGSCTVTPGNTMSISGLLNLSTSSSILVIGSNTLTTSSITGGTAMGSTGSSYLSISTGKVIVISVPATTTLIPIYSSNTTAAYLPITFTGTTNAPNITVGISSAPTNSPSNATSTVYAQWAVSASVTCSSTIGLQYATANTGFTGLSTNHVVLGRYSSTWSELDLGVGSSAVSGSGPYTLSTSPTVSGYNLPAASIVNLSIGLKNSFAASSLTTNIVLSSINANYGASPITLSPTTNNGGGAITYTSGNTSVATINGSTVTIVGVGTSLITASQLANGNYTTGSTTATLTVNAVAPATPIISNVSSGNNQAIISFAENNWGGNTGTFTITPSSGTAVTGVLSSPYTFTGLTNGLSYTFTVTAINGAGSSATSAASSSVTPNQSPAVPTNVSATGGNVVATITFTPPSNATAAQVDNYIITPYLSGVQQTPITDTVGLGVTATQNYTVTGLQVGGSYTFTVAGYSSATNLTGTASSQTSAVVPTGTYTWVGGFGTGSQQTDYQQAANWNPSRVLPTTQDVLQFTNNAANTVTNVPTQTIARLVLTGTTAVSLQAVSGSSKTLSVGYSHANGVDEISVPAGCTLTLANNADGVTGNTFTLGLANVTNVTSNIAGTLTIEPNVTVTGSGAVTYANNTGYTLNQLVIDRGNLYKVTTAGTSAVSPAPGPNSTSGTSTQDGTGSVYFSYIGSQYSVTYATSTTYSLGQLVNNGGNLYQVTTAGSAASSGAGPTVTTGSVTDGGTAGNQFFTYIGPAVSGNYASAYSNVYDVHYGITTVSGTVNYAGKFNNTSAYSLTTTNTLQFTSGSNFNNQRSDAAFPGANSSHIVTLSPYYNNVNVTISGAAGSTGLNLDQFPSSVNTFNVVTPYLNGGSTSSGLTLSSLSNNVGTFSANGWYEAMTGTGGLEVIFGSKITNINIGSGGVNISGGSVYFANGYSQAMTVTGDFTLSGTGGFAFLNGINTASLTVNNFTHSGTGFFQLNNSVSQTGSTLIVNGNFFETNSNYFLSNYPCTLKFAGSVNQTYFSSSTFGAGLSIVIANTGTAPNNTVTLNSKFTVGGTLTLTSGVLVSSATNYLTIGTSGFTGGSSTAYVTGPIYYASAATSAFTLPTGYGGVYAPIIITPSATTSVTFQVNYAPVTAIGTINSPLTSIASASAYSINLSSGFNSATVSFPYSFTSGVVGNTNQLVVASYLASWSEVSASPIITGSTTSGNISDATVIPFTTIATNITVGSISSSSNLLSVSTDSSGPQLTIYASPNGSDIGNGTTFNLPVSLARARVIAQSYPNNPSTILLEDGTYYQLTLTAADTRSSSANQVTYKAINRGSVIFQPLKVLNRTDFQPIPTNIKNRIVSPTAQNKVMQLNLATYGFNSQSLQTWPGTFRVSNITLMTPQFYLNGSPMMLSRYPNNSTMSMNGVIYRGTNIADSGGIFHYTDLETNKWLNAINDEGLWLAGNWNNTYELPYIQTKSIDTVNKIIYQSFGYPNAVTNGRGGIGNKFYGSAGCYCEPYYVSNIFEEIDTVGEYSVNFNNDMLYMWLPDTGTIQYADSLTMPAISVSNVNFTQFQNIFISGGAGSGFTLNNCNNVTIAGCDVSKCANNAINLNYVNNCTIKSNDLHNIGAGGVVFGFNIYFSATDLNTLRASNNYIINNHIYDYAKQDVLYSGAITVNYSNGNYIANNKVNNTPHIGIQFYGNNNIYEYNEIDSVVMQYGDMGAFYAGGDWTNRGNTLYHNYIHDNFAGAGANGLYLDENKSGDSCSYNIIANSVYGLFSNGGSYNRFNNNYTINCSRPVVSNALADTSSTYTGYYNNVQTLYNNNNAWRTNYPSLYDLLKPGGTNFAFTSQIWSQYKNNAFLTFGPKFSGQTFSNVADNLVFNADGSTNNSYCQTGLPFTKWRTVFQNNFKVTNKLINPIYPFNMDSLRAPGILTLAGGTAWHINRLGLYVDSFRTSLGGDGVHGVDPTILLTTNSSNHHLYPDTTTFVATVTNPNIANCISSVQFLDNNMPITGLTITKKGVSYDTVTYSATWNGAASGNHSITFKVLDSTIWQYTSNTATFTTTSLNWTGAVSTDWGTAGNWSANKIPTITDWVVIPGTGITRMPTLSIADGKGYAKRLTVNAGATFTLNDTLIISGNLQTSGIITGTSIIQTSDTSATPLTAGQTWAVGVQYNAPSNQTIVKGNYGNLNIAGGPRTLYADTIGISGNFTGTTSNLTTTGSTIIFNGSTLQTIPAATYGDLILKNSVGTILGGNVATTNLLIDSAGTLTTGNYNLILGDSAIFTPSTQLNISGGTTDFGGNSVIFQSSLSGTATLATVTGTLLNATNATSQRYITAKTARKYSFLGSPVTASIRNSWQQQAYITGAGSGGVTCGSTSGDGGSTDKFNSNGFDKSPSNLASMFNYKATSVNGSRWVSVANTDHTNLSPGIGYRINIRGNRNSGTVTCANQLNSSSPTAPEAVTLSATGVLATGNVTVTLNDTTGHKYTLLANPYQSPISYTAFQSSNSSKINNKMWTFSPFGNGNYTTYLQGVIANGATGYDNVRGNYVSVGQAFFVEASANGSVSFQESHKTNGVIPNTQYFGTAINPMFRVGLKTSKDSVLLDEIVVRFDKSGTRNYNQTNDAITFNAGNQVLTSIKEGNALSIATHSDTLSIDTTQIGIISQGNGSFKLKFSDFEGMDVAKNITLMDNFLGIIQNIRENPVYDFNVSADSNSQGNNRFKVLVGNSTILPLNKISLSVAKNEEGIGVRWSVANQDGIHSYIVERGYDNLHFEGIATSIVKADYHYYFQDNNLSDSANTTYYRIKAVSETGLVDYSNVCKLITNYVLGITLYPNPLTGKVLNVSFSNIAAGKYEISIYNSLGEKVNEQQINHAGGTSNHALATSNNLAVGIYNVVISNKGSGSVVCRKRLVVSYE